MIIFIIILVVIIFLVLFSNISTKLAQEEVTRQGGLRNIFSTLEEVLEDNDFEFYEDKNITVEYRKKLDQHSFMRLIIRKTIWVQHPFEMQLFHVISGQVNSKTMPWIIRAHLLFDEYQKNVLQMLQQLRTTQV